MQTGDDLDQRGLACAVVTEHACYFTRTDAQVDSLERDDVSVLLTDVLELDQWHVAARVRESGNFSCGTHVSPFRSVVAECVVGDDREEQHGAEEELEPVRVPACVDDALVGHTEDECADRSADRGSVTTGEQATADDCGDDVQELVTDTPDRTERC